ncbi:hypothetical protein [Phenylobacterium sp.]|uniref:phage fiber-tail adaptor protein n=1 Tax=Phenylobacterium sp. TaxID=1871053 RepID=UPI002732A357|nr:hypothetical protein [Phenylobacterium sp.]MDP3855334.1 hypothetical protein [Phenylobacterium sp.]
MATTFKYDAAGPWIAKDPNAVLDYQLNWDAIGDSWLNGDTISAATWTVAAGITKDSDDRTTTTTRIWLSGGTAGQTYVVSCRIMTAGGRVEDRSFRIVCAER